MQSSIITSYSYSTHFKALIRLAFPLIAAQIAQISMGFIDTLMLGRLSSQALAALAWMLTLPLLLLLWNMEPIFLSMGQEPEIAHQAQRYLQAISLGILPNLSFGVLSS